jgi:signal transduction histidine kinase
MSRLLGLLRRGGDEPTLGPQPGIADVDTLLETVREAGVPVELQIEGTQTPLPTGVDLSAYRIVQEALTNVVKHAGRATARVVLRYEPDAIELEITDDGRGAADAEPGYGLTGMRERALLHGGSLTARGGDAAGFTVRARLPLATARP